MPCNYAHYRMGAQALSALPEDAWRSIQRFRRLYNAGLQGPDLLFYHNPFWQTETTRLGYGLHEWTGEKFFTQVCARLKQEPSEAGLVYVYGLLGHYCLDSLAHPYVNEATRTGDPGHIELEVEFDRFLLERDGRSPAHRQYLGKNVKLTPGECQTISHFLQPATYWQVRRSAAMMKLCMWLLTAPSLRRLVEAVVKHLGPTVREQLMTAAPNPRCAQLDEAMLEKYDAALARYPEMLHKLRSYMEEGTPLGEEFEATFG